MSTILLCGSYSYYRPLLDAIGDGHDIYIYSPDEEIPSDGDRVTVITALEEAPVTFDGVFDLQEWGVYYHMYDALTESTTFFTNANQVTATEAAMWTETAAVLGVSYIPALFDRNPLLETAPAMQNAPKQTERGIALLNALMPAKEVELLVDRLGLVSARTLAMVINEAAFAAMEGVASVDDIDLAMKLGTNYPEGPLRWVDSIGAETVVRLLDGLQREYGEERYRPCVLLRQMARSGGTFHR